MLNNDRSSLIRDRFAHTIDVRRAVGDGRYPHLDLLTCTVGPNDPEVVRMNLSSNNDFLPTGVTCSEETGLRKRAPPVVHRRVCNIHSGEIAYHRLVFIDRLQGPLADFRLVRSVSGGKFGPADDRSDG